MRAVNCMSLGLCVAVLAGLVAGAAQAATVVHAGWLFDANSARLLERRSVIIEDGKVTSTASGFTQPGPNDMLIDLSEATVMPGWIDMHVHIDPARHNCGLAQIDEHVVRAGLGKARSSACHLAVFNDHAPAL